MLCGTLLQIGVVGVQRPGHPSCSSMGMQSAVGECGSGCAGSTWRASGLPGRASPSRESSSGQSRLPEPQRQESPACYRRWSTLTASPHKLLRREQCIRSQQRCMNQLAWLHVCTESHSGSKACALHMQVLLCRTHLRRGAWDFRVNSLLYIPPERSSGQNKPLGQVCAIASCSDTT